MPRTVPNPLTADERQNIARKMEAKTPLTWEECDRLLDHIEFIETNAKECPGSRLDHKEKNHD